MQFHAERAQYLDDCREARIAFGRKRLVKALAPHAHLLCEIGHAFRLRYDAESMGEERRVIVENRVHRPTQFGQSSVSHCKDWY